MEKQSRPIALARRGFLRTIALGSIGLAAGIRVAESAAPVVEKIKTKIPKAWRMVRHDPSKASNLRGYTLIVGFIDDDWTRPCDP